MNCNQNVIVITTLMWLMILTNCF